MLLTITPIIVQKASMAPRLSTLYFHSKSEGIEGMLELEGTSKNAVIIIATNAKEPIESPDMGLYFRDKRE